MCFSVEIIRDLKSIAKLFGAEINAKGFHYLDKMKDEYPKEYKLPKEDNRIYPNYFSPVIINFSGKKLIAPMRYRIRPSGSEKEIPSKYNLFNARYDKLTTRKTWTSLLGKNHLILPMKRFYEWVLDDKGKKILVSFSPKGKEYMWAPGIYDKWISPDGKKIIESFAIITDDPQKEVLEKGHDRNPIFLKSDLVDDWLDTDNKGDKDYMEILKQKESVFFEFSKS